LEQENRNLKAKVTESSTQIEKLTLEIRREKDINDILILKNKESTVSKSRNEESPGSSRSQERQETDESINITGEYRELDDIEERGDASGIIREKDFCEKEFRFGRGSCVD
jgi:hypothetical protein